MDDRSFWLIVAILVSSVITVVIAGVGHFDVPAGFWAVPGGIVTLITVLSARNGKKNGVNHQQRAGDEMLTDAQFILKYGYGRDEL